LSSGVRKKRVYLCRFGRAGSTHNLWGVPEKNQKFFEMSPPAAPVVPPREFLVETRTITGFQQRYDVVMSRDKLWFVHPDVKVELEGFWQLPGERCPGSR
jgi:hypothetical protein